MKKIIFILLLIVPAGYASADWMTLLGGYSPKESRKIVAPKAKALIESFAGALDNGSVENIGPYFPAAYLQGRQRKLMQMLVDKYKGYGRYISTNAITLERCSVFVGSNDYPNCLYSVDLKFERGKFLEKVIVGRPKTELKITSILTIQPH